MFKLLGHSDQGEVNIFAQVILKTLYPQVQDHASSNIPNTQVIPEKPFSKNEIRRVLKKVPLKKAPGFDSIDNIILKQINKKFPVLLHTFFNRCLHLQCFPTSLKIGIILLFHKKDKEKFSINQTIQSLFSPPSAKSLKKFSCGV
ncbi:hypothetical protein AVEN_250431-1 [Araneus ventricosus]|uniref:Reverse transcriptase domain-containing protein n=1 Tax=Araneus ventricosus TaxID=182803 RepID=A0A4Y2EEY4_ARAVE|nr:hypothetical protein AVEN_250431-1 [Araneus ventricosus]